MKENLKYRKVDEMQFLSLLQTDFDNSFVKYDKKLPRKKYEDLLLYIRDKSAMCYGAFCDNSLVGFIWGYVINTISEKRVHISFFAVTEKLRNKGIGKNLLKVLEESSKEKGITEIELMVSSNNFNAIEFYNKNGFIEERKLLYKINKM